MLPGKLWTRKARLKSIKTIYKSALGGFEKCLISIAPMACMLHAFVYNAVDIKNFVN